MADEFETFVNEAALTIKGVLAERIGKNTLPTYRLHVVDEAITDEEEEVGGEVSLDEKFSHSIEDRDGIILDEIDVKKAAGEYPGSWGSSINESSYPYVILHNDGSISRRVSSAFPATGEYLPCHSPYCCRSENVFPTDYLAYAGKALDAIQKLFSPNVPNEDKYYMVFLDEGAGGYGYWIADSLQTLENSIKGEEFLEEVRCGMLPRLDEKQLRKLLDSATRFTTDFTSDSYCENGLDMALDYIEAIRNPR